MTTDIGGRQHHNIADAIEGGAIDACTVAGAATRRNAAMTELSTGERSHRAGSASRRNQHGGDAIRMTHFASSSGWHVGGNQPTHGFEGSAVIRVDGDTGAMAGIAATGDPRVAELPTGKSSLPTGRPQQRNQASGNAIGVTYLASCRSGHVRRR